MRITIEDLEALKELSDELEENHVETEKQLQEDLGLWQYYPSQYSYHCCLNRCQGHPNSGSPSQNWYSWRIMSRFGQHHQPIPRIRYATTGVRFLPQSSCLLIIFTITPINHVQRTWPTPYTNPDCPNWVGVGCFPNCCYDVPQSQATIICHEESCTKHWSWT